MFLSCKYEVGKRTSCPAKLMPVNDVFSFYKSENQHLFWFHLQQMIQHPQFIFLECKQNQSFTFKWKRERIHSYGGTIDLTRFMMKMFSNKRDRPLDLHRILQRSVTDRRTDSIYVYKKEDASKNDISNLSMSVWLADASIQVGNLVMKKIIFETWIWQTNKNVIWNLGMTD